MLCKDQMEPRVEAIRQTMPIRDAAQLMKKRDIGFLPICDAKKQRLVGTLTDRDIAIRFAADGMSPDTPVEKIMTKNVICCSTNDDVDEARRLMEENQVSRMIVLDENNHVAGVISLADLAGDGVLDETIEQIKSP